jgi:carbon storage regulator
MLILSRNILETIMVGDDIQIKVLGFDHKAVRLGIKAPLHVSVHRQEIYERLRSHKLQYKNETIK